MNGIIIIPTYNELQNIGSLITEVLKVCPETQEILVVDDGSPDGTGELVDSLAEKNPRIHILHREGKKGLASAYIAGMLWSLEKGYDTIIQMDADFSHHPQYLPKMLELLRSYDVVIGSRNVKDGGTLNWGLVRKVVSRGGSFYSRMILRCPIHDMTGGFNGWKAATLKAVDPASLGSEGYAFQIELKYRAFLQGHSWMEFPILFEDRKTGQSKMTVDIFLEAIYRVWQFRFQKGYSSNRKLGNAAAHPEGASGFKKTVLK